MKHEKCKSSSGKTKALEVSFVKSICFYNYFCSCFCNLEYNQWHIDKSLKNLTCLYLEHNPIYTDTSYRRKIIFTLPNLKQIDATLCHAQE